MNLRLDKFISLLSKEYIAVAITDTPDYESGKLLWVTKLESSTSTNQTMRRDEVLVYVR